MEARDRSGAHGGLRGGGGGPWKGTGKKTTITGMNREERRGGRMGGWGAGGGGHIGMQRVRGNE